MTTPATTVPKLPELFAIYRRLRSCDTVSELFAQGSDLVREAGGFDRALVLVVQDATLTVRGVGALRHGPSDQLRRAILAEPLAIAAGSEEGEHVRRPLVAGPRRPAASPLAERLGLRHHAYAAIAPDDDALALLVVDRAARPLAEEEVEAVGSLGAAVALALDHVVLRMRAAQLADEVRQFAGAARALAREVREAPVALPSDTAFGAAFTGTADGGRRSRLVRERFSARERSIADLIAAGRTNRQIAEALVLSPETVKSHVSRILRKLGAANRAEAAARYLHLTQQGDD